MGSTFTIALTLLAVSADPGETYTRVHPVKPIQLNRQLSARSSTSKSRLKVNNVSKHVYAPKEELIVSPSDTEVYDNEADSCPHCSQQRGTGWLWWWNRCCDPLPNASISPGDMMPHIPYIAEPKGSYYFRPYGVLDIAPIQAEVMQYEVDPRTPYEEDIFEGVYKKMRSGMIKK